MAEPTIICPNCKTEIKLTESLAAPLIEATRREYEQRLAQKQSNISRREAALSRERKAIMKQWAKREGRIVRVMGATVGMYGDLQEIEGLELAALEQKAPRGSE